MPAKKPAVAIEPTATDPIATDPIATGTLAADKATSDPHAPSDANATAQIQPDIQPPQVQPPGAQPGGPAKARTKTLDKSLFIYRPAEDAYRCPANRSLIFWKNDSEKHNGGTAKIRIYRSTDCGNCALAGQCIASHSKGKLRTIRRDQHEPLREQMAARMATEQGKSKYRRRSFLSETPFAVLNTTMNVVQLLLRGTEKVTAEIGWICSAYNLKKLTRLIAASRQPAMIVS
jgi:hypothetical protein